MNNKRLTILPMNPELLSGNKNYLVTVTDSRGNRVELDVSANNIEEAIKKAKKEVRSDGEISISAKRVNDGVLHVMSTNLSGKAGALGLLTESGADIQRAGRPIIMQNTIAASRSELINSKKFYEVSWSDDNLNQIVVIVPAESRSESILKAKDRITTGLPMLNVSSNLTKKAYYLVEKVKGERNE